MRFKKGFNPFYLLLVVIGTAFCLTACAYGLMALRSLRPQYGADKPAAGPHQLMDFMERHGDRMLLYELAALAVASFAAMATDGYWQRRAAEQAAHKRTDEISSGETNL